MISLMLEFLQTQKKWLLTAVAREKCTTFQGLNTQYYKFGARNPFHLQI